MNIINKNAPAKETIAEQNGSEIVSYEVENKQLPTQMGEK